MILFLLAITAGPARADKYVNITGTTPDSYVNDIGFTFTFTGDDIKPIGLELSVDGGSSWDNSPSDSENVNGQAGTGYGDLFITPGQVLLGGEKDTLTMEVASDVTITGWWFTFNGPNVDPIDPTTGFRAIYKTGITYSPIPEPSTWAMVLLGLLGLAVFGRHPMHTVKRQEEV